MIWLVWVLVLLSGCSPSLRCQNQYLSTSDSAGLSSRYQHGSTVVFLDPGHGGQDIGASVQQGGLREKVLTLDIVKRIGALLQEQGYKVCYSRVTDVTLSLKRRVQRAKRSKAAILVSIHLNSAQSPNGRGVEVYYFSSKRAEESQRSVDSKWLATLILSHLARNLSLLNRGVKQGNFYVIRESTMPSVLVEAAFLTNVQDAALVASAQTRQKMAYAIASGIHMYFTHVVT